MRATRRARTLTLLFSLLLLANCTAAPAPTPSPRPSSPSSRTVPSPTASPPPTAVHPSTWTPMPPASPQPSLTPSPTGSGTATASPVTEGWDPDAIPSITLTPTPSGSVPYAARSAYSSALDAYQDQAYEDALILVDQALDLAREQVDYLTLRGQILIALVRPLDGSAELRRALSIDPFHAPARRAMAELYLYYHRERDAAAEFGRYLTLAPEDATGWYALGQIWEGQGLPLEAITAYSRTLELEPTHQGGLGRRGALWLEQENLLAAWSDYSALVIAHPDAEAYLTRGEINLQLDAPLLAAADLEAGLALLPAETQSYSLTMQIGQAYLQGGAAIEAAAAFSEAISLTATIEPHLWLGKSYRAAGDYAETVELYDAIFDRITPLEAGELLAGRGEAYLALKEYDAALTDLSDALYYAKGTEDRVTILAWRAAAFAALEQLEEAITDLSAAYELAPTPSLLFQRGVLYLQAGDEEAAAADLVAFLENADPDRTNPEQLQAAQTHLDSLTADSP